MLEHQMKQVAFYNRVFLSIVEGYFGFFSDGPGVETGDCVYTVLGCSYSLALRPTTRRECLVSGECFCGWVLIIVA
ncbi:hypothetical protein F4824DRAFT_484625 [Ustulina deusta]|nr:hypothetical protein F4824DRAFT_484625 [Ustulina deusta]